MPISPALSCSILPAVIPGKFKIIYLLRHLYTLCPTLGVCFSTVSCSSLFKCCLFKEILPKLKVGFYSYSFFTVPWSSPSIYHNFIIYFFLHFLVNVCVPHLTVRATWVGSIYLGPLLCVHCLSREPGIG